MNGRIVRSEPDSGPQMPILGKVKIGEKRMSAKGKEYPNSLDYFRFDGKFGRLAEQAYGEKPDRLAVAFLSDDVGQVCNERFECRDDKGRLVARGDGVTTEIYDPSSGNYLPHTDVPREKLKALGTWTTVLTLRFVLLKVRTVMGVWEFSTRGKASSIPKIRGIFDYVMAQVGSVTPVPFDLIVQKVQSQKPGETRVFPVVDLIPNIGTEEMQSLAEYASQGGRIRGVLTAEKIHALAAGAEQGEHIHEPQRALPEPMPEPAPAEAEIIEPSSPAVDTLFAITETEEANRIGAEIYGDLWPAKCAELCAEVTTGGARALSELMPPEMAKLLAHLRAEAEKLPRFHENGADSPGERLSF